MLHRVFATTACLFVLGLSACAPRPEAPAAPPAAAPAEPPLTPPAAAGGADGPTGSFVAVSNTATSITGNVDVSADGLLFDVGHVYATGPGRTLSLAELPVDLFPGLAATASYTLRQVTDELVNAQAPNGGLCRPEATTWLVLGHDAASGTLAVAAFTGAEAPAVAASPCGTFSYAAG